MHFLVKLDDRKLILKLLMHVNNIFTYFLIFPLRSLGIISTRKRRLWRLSFFMVLFPLFLFFFLFSSLLFSSLLFSSLLFSSLLFSSLSLLFSSLLFSSLLSSLFSLLSSLFSLLFSSLLFSSLLFSSLLFSSLSSLLFSSLLFSSLLFSSFSFFFSFLFFSFLFFSFLFFSFLSSSPFFGRVGGGGGKPAAPLWIRAWVILNKVKVSNLCGKKNLIIKKVFEFKLCHIRRQWETKLYYECKDEVLSISSVVKDSTYRGQ